MVAEKLQVTTKYGKRHYHWDGQELPSVTTVLKVIDKPGLVGWARKIAFETFAEVMPEVLLQAEPQGLGFNEMTELVMETADKRYWKNAKSPANFGKDAHALIQEILLGNDPEVPLLLTQVIDNFKTWYSNSGLQLVVAESQVLSTVHGYAGTIDIMAHREADLVMVDWKTSDDVWPEMAFQLAAYAHAFTETFSLPIKEAWILRLGKKKPDFQVYQIRDLEESFQGFLGALKLYNSLENDHWQS